MLFDARGAARALCAGRPKCLRAGPVMVLLLATFLGACGGMSRDDWPADHPRIDDARFLGQNPRNPWGLVFAIDFADGDGNLGVGKLRLSIDDVEASVISLMGLFARQSPSIESTATEGTFEVEVDLEGRIKSGQELEFSFVLQDSDGKSSNKPRIKLRALIPE